MKFSVITVCYNAGDKLAHTVENVLRQTFDDYEILIKDGGSTDGSVRRLRNIKSEKIRIVSNPDKGIYDAMNEAARLANGDYIIFLNAGDEFYSEGVLERASKLLPEKSNLIAYGDTYFAKSDSISKAPPKITGSVCYRNIPCHQAIFYSRDTLTKRGFDTSYKIRADFEHFSYCFFKAGTEFQYLGYPICFYEGGGFSEKKDNKSRDSKEYTRAVRANIPVMNRFAYRLTLILTLHKLRGFLANNKKTAKLYQSIKGKLYG